MGFKTLGAKYHVVSMCVMCVESVEKECSPPQG